MKILYASFVIDLLTFHMYFMCPKYPLLCSVLMSISAMNAPPTPHISNLARWRWPEHFILTDLRHIYTTSEISAWASESKLGCNQNKWKFHVYTDLICVRDFLPRTSVSKLVATCSDFLGRWCPRLCNAYIQSHLFTWSLSWPPINGHGLGWPWIRALDVV